MAALKTARCSTCGRTVYPARGPRAKLGLTALHYASRMENPGTARERRCAGSDTRFADQGAVEPFPGAFDPPPAGALLIRVDFVARRLLSAEVL